MRNFKEEIALKSKKMDRKIKKKLITSQNEVLFSEASKAIVDFASSFKC